MAAFFVVLVLGWSGLVTAQDQPEAQVQSEVVADPIDSVTGIPADAYPTTVETPGAIDTPNDDGGSILISWTISADDVDSGKVVGYKIFRATMTDGQAGEFTEVGDVPRGKTEFSDGSTDDDFSYVYQIHAYNLSRVEGETLWLAKTESGTSNSAQSSAQWFHWGRLNIFIGVGILIFFIIYYVQQAKAGKKLFIRRIAGLDAVDEAVGRATEMGKKIFFVPGTQDMNDVQTIAGISILGHVAGLAAQYETFIEVPVSRSLVMVTASEVVKEAYSKVGRPDAFNENQVHYLTDDQFGYAAAVDGMVVREKPATIFYMGAFFAESLILAETGNSVGAIQIAGTAMPSQLPFFVAACDYTLIGEELFAASAYLSGEPKMLGSLKGQDAGKAIILLMIIIGVLLQTFGLFDTSQLFSVN